MIQGRLKRWLNLLGYGLLLMLIWMWLLPRLAQTPVIKEHLQLLEDRNINAGAMFYTEVQEHR